MLVIYDLKRQRFRKFTQDVLAHVEGFVTHPHKFIIPSVELGLRVRDRVEG